MTTRISHDRAGKQNPEKQRLTTALHETNKATASNTIRVTRLSPDQEHPMTINRNNKPMDHFPEVVSLLSTGMTQKAVANSLHIRPAAVSEMDIIRKQCPWAFIAPFVTIRVPLSKLHGFARVLRRRGLRRSDKDMVEVTAVLQAKAKEYRDAALAAIKKGTFAPKEDSLDAFQPVPPPVEWYRSCNLSGIDDVGNPTGLCADERFRAQFRKAYRPPEDFASAKEWLDAITAK